MDIYRLDVISVSTFRVFYVVNRPEAVHVLHAFRKTTEKTDKRDIDVAKARFKSLD